MQTVRAGDDVSKDNYVVRRYAWQANRDGGQVIGNLQEIRRSRYDDQQYESWISQDAGVTWSLFRVRDLEELTPADYKFERGWVIKVYDVYGDLAQNHIRTYDGPVRPITQAASVSLAIEASAKMRQQLDMALTARERGDIGNYFRALSCIHRLNRPAVDRGQYDPYIVDWTLIFTPIEDDAWYSIRTLGLRMFPQYPVGRFFVDFGDPWLKCAIECDGRQWHTPERDARRDAELGALGWRVLHLPGNRLVLGEDHPRCAHHLVREFIGLPVIRTERGV